MITYKIHLLRTGSTSARKKQISVGQLDLLLSEEGKQDLLQKKEKFRYPPAQVVFSSPLHRCIETAELLYPDTQLILKENMKDLNLGVFQGRSFSALSQDEDFQKWSLNSLEHPPPGGEDTYSFTGRLVDGIEEIFHTMMEEGLSQVALITHGGVIMSLLAAIGLPRQPVNQWLCENGTGFTILLTPQMWMRDQLAEVYNYLPYPPLEEDFL